ncbi:MAG TPA: FtsH protease activity modulator HflK [Pirellulales bacterium]|jgi:membrane protease subunit HflK|nr:FtsH protease activity modulator HflK [Pirellulales bacterium]
MISLRTILLLAAAGYALTGVYVVEPDQQAVVRRFGRAQRMLREPGAHWGLPWPMDRVDRLRPRATRQVSLGVPDSAGGALDGGVAQLLTGDRNLVNVRATVQYSVAEPAAYLFRSATAEGTIRSAAEAILTEELAGQGVDRALTQGKRELGVRAGQRLQTFAEAYELGVTVHSLDLVAVEPPGEVAASFDQVTSALRQREQAINEAYSYREQTRAEAEGAAQSALDGARAYRDRTVALALGDSERYASLLVEYRRQPSLTSTRLYLDAMAEILPRLRSKLILGGEEVDVSILREEGAGKRE